MTAAAALLLAALLAPGPAPRDELLRLPIGDPARRDRTAHVVLDAITDTATGEILTPGDLPKRLEGIRLLLVGEAHTDMDSHRVERRVLEELHRAGRRVTVALEMFPYTEQKALDDWSTGGLTEERFLDDSHWYRSWGYNWAYYRDIFLLARDAGMPLRAVNVPREAITTVRKKGYQGLTPEEAAHIPSHVDSKNAEHMRMFKASFDDASFHAGMDDAAWQAMLDAQCAWDATMGFQAVQALEGDADAKEIVAGQNARDIVVVLVGAGHVSYGLGIERQVRSQGFEGGVASVIAVPVVDDKGKSIPSVQASYASFVWGTPPASDPLYPELGVATRARSEDKLLEVIDVEKDSPAAHSGVKTGDVLLAVDGETVPDREALARAMAGKRWGDTAAVTVRRGGEQQLLTVKLRRSLPQGRKP
ncbi:MAG TPA: ChaN family lipoprotein [Thermoanaerobaculia bacterium]|nr:ChaN family lipoprotein [Thermoanaerobaculia bacterium]